VGFVGVNADGAGDEDHVAFADGAGVAHFGFPCGAGGDGFCAVAVGDGVGGELRHVCGSGLSAKVNEKRVANDKGSRRFWRGGGCSGYFAPARLLRLSAMSLSRACWGSANLAVPSCMRVSSIFCWLTFWLISSTMARAGMISTWRV